MRRGTLGQSGKSVRWVGDYWSIIALVLVALNFVAPATALIVSCVVAGFLVWQADVRFFPALFLLHFSARNFILEGFGTEDYVVETLDYAYMNIGGFPVTVGNIVAIVMTVRWLYAWLFERNPALKKNERLIWLWLLAVPISLAITVNAYARHLLTPAQAVRGLLGFGVFFYGMLVAPSWVIGGRYLVDRFLLFIGTLCLLGLLGLCGTNFFFFCLAIGPVLAIASMRSAGTVESKLVSIFALTLSLAYAIIGQPGGDEMIRSTLTSMGQGILSLLIGLFFVGRGQSNLFLKSFRFAVVACLLFTGYAISSADLVDPDRILEGTMRERLNFKLYGDRAPLWRRTWDKVCSPPYVIREYIPFVSEAGKEQKYGAHNTYLQTLDIQGWWSGSLFILLIWIAMTRAEQSVRRMKDILLKGVYGGLYVVCTVGVTTGHSAGGGDYLFFWGVLAGICIGLPFCAKMTSAPAGSAGPQRSSPREQLAGGA